MMKYHYELTSKLLVDILADTEEHAAELSGYLKQRSDMR